eukprot:TRINITY_DN55_c0_g3_i2.p1 TRINITY_DN55_c0_g3~~TRINITY_DN55_c0_g3_i2.p1  ORF type:complete len:364 (+),score=55.57 TRINITY_DN55_c0_g3_i2:29-1120(+)
MARLCSIALTILSLLALTAFAQGPDAGFCPFRIGIAVDTSSSIYKPIYGGSPDNIDIIKNSLLALVSILEGTATIVRLVTFATNSTVLSPIEVPGGPLYVDMQNPVEVVQLRASIENMAFSSGTNWEAGLQEFLDLYNFRFDNNEPNLLLFITDGKPNLCYKLTACGGGFNEQAALDQALFVREQLQDFGTTILPVGVGSSISIDPIIKLATCAPTLCKEGTDYIAGASFTDLLKLDLLISLATKKCCDIEKCCGQCPVGGAGATPCPNICPGTPVPSPSNPFWASGSSNYPSDAPPIPSVPANLPSSLQQFSSGVIPSSDAVSPASTGVIIIAVLSSVAAAGGVGILFVVLYKLGFLTCASG